MTKTSEKAALDAYFKEGDSWAQDQRQALRMSRRLAWIVAGVASTIALLEALALIALTPLKTVQPYTLLVDRQTGFVQALSPLEPQTVSGDTALTQSFLVQYVIAREGYDYSVAQTNYRKVALWSDGAARRSYLADMQAGSPNSPLYRYPQTTIVDVQIKSVTPVGRKTAMVRFDTRRIDSGGGTAPTQAWVAYVRYEYSGAPMSVADRFINPLGFKVLSYRRSMEMLPAPAPQNVAGPIAGQLQVQPYQAAGRASAFDPGRPSGPLPSYSGERP